MAAAIRMKPGHSSGAGLANRPARARVDWGDVVWLFASALLIAGALVTGLS